MIPIDAAFWETRWREIVKSAPTRKRERRTLAVRLKR